MNNSTILKRIAIASPAFRVKLMKDCQAHSTAQCNGDYVENEDTGKWEGYDHVRFTWDNKEAAQKGEDMEKSILKRLKALTGTKNIPDFLGYAGDPRGFTLKIDSDKLDADEIALCESIEFLRDWGGDFAIVKDRENLS